MRIVPVTSAPFQKFSMVLESKKIDFDIRHVNLVDRWLVSLSQDGTEILNGQRLVMGIDLLASHNFGLGGLFCYASERPGDDPQRGDFPGRVQLIHASEEEIAAVRS